MQRISTVLWILFGIANIYAVVWNDCSEVFEPVEVIAQTVTLPSPAEIDYKAGLGKEFREALANRKDINWNVVQDNYREWSEHTTTLSGPARMLVACVLTVVTNGMGTEWFAGHGIAEGTAMNAALSAGIQVVTVSAETGLAGNLGDIGKTFDELTSAASLKSLAASMLTAGLSQSLSSSLQLPDAPKTFTESLKKNTTHGLVQTGVDSAISGGKVGKNLVQNMTTSAVGAGSAQIAHTIGDAKHSGALDQVTHKVAHAGLGAASSALTGGDAVAGAIGAVASETAAETLHKEGKDPAKTAAQARIIGDTVAFVAGRDVASADSAGRTAVENNFGGIHDDEGIPPVDILLENSDKPLSEQLLTYTQASIEEGVKEDKLWDQAAPKVGAVSAKGAVLGVAMCYAPNITIGYFATQSAARWAGTYAGGGMEAIKQEFRDHPILSTVDLATTGMLGAGFVKSIAKVPQLIEAGQTMYKHHKAVGQLKGNVKQGKLFEEKEFHKSVSENGGGETQLTVEAQDGTRVRLDYVFKNPKNPEDVIIREFKSSPTAPLTKNQKVAYPLIEQSGAKVVGAGKGVFVPGLSLPPTRIEIIRPKK